MEDGTTTAGTGDPIDEIARLMREASRGMDWPSDRYDAIARSMRLWALDVAEEVAEACPDLTGERDPTTAARVIAAARTEILADMEDTDVTLVNDAIEDLHDAIGTVAIHEMFDAGRQRHACTREAMAAVRAAAQDPFVESDIRGLAIRLSAVAEHAVLALAYRDAPTPPVKPKPASAFDADPALAEITERVVALGGGIENNYFFRRRNPRLDIRLAEMRLAYGSRWLGMLRARLDDCPPEDER